MERVTAWFMVDGTVHVESWTAPVIESQLRDSGWAMIRLKNDQGSAPHAVVCLRRCDRLDVDKAWTPSPAVS